MAARIVQNMYHNDIYPTAEEIGVGGYGQLEEQEMIAKKVERLVKTFHMDGTKDKNVRFSLFHIFLLTAYH